MTNGIGWRSALMEHNFLSHLTTEHLDQRLYINLQNLKQPLLDSRELSSEQTSLHNKL